MPDFNQFEEVAQAQKDLVRGLVDEFLIYHAANTSNVGEEFDRQLKRFQQAVKKLPFNWSAMAKSQYIAHRIFKAGGLVNNYIRQRAFLSRSAAELSFLQRQIEYPWRFIFAVLTDTPAPNVYRMKDVFRGDNYAIYSPGMAGMLAEQSARLWFHLIAFNGVCWETYGPMISFCSFDADDIFFFATELNPHIETDEDVVADVERNPLPYMMLMIGSGFPTVFHRGDEMVYLTSTISVDRFSSDQVPKGFIASYNKGVYRLALKRWDDFPHIANAYYHERKQEMLLTALTDRGFEALLSAMQKGGFDVTDADVRVHPQMLQTIQQVLKKKVNLNPYEHLFDQAPASDDAMQLEKINAVLQLALPYINNDQQPDIDALAAQAGVDPAAVREAVEKAIGHIMRRRKEL
jgi:hypothetical protein